MKNAVSFFVGNESFDVQIKKNAYYVDKTAYLQTLFMSSAEEINSCFIRPRRFGKTLNLSMIQDFCELNYQKPGENHASRNSLLTTAETWQLPVMIMRNCGIKSWASFR